VSDHTGLSKPSLSQIENNSGAPPIATLIKISHALGIKIGYFFQDAPDQPRLVVVRREARLEIKQLNHTDRYAGIGYRYESLAHPMVDKQMEPFIVEIDPRGIDQIPFNTHDGEEFIFVLNGRLEFRSPDQVIELAPEDSIYFDSSIPHGLRGIGAPARVMVVVFTG
jgi:quercetin dioxygenase-like cupin family protein/DNA-binding XRE family transcriptional regulator